MTQLEQTIAERARAHLAGLQTFYAKAKAGTAVEDDRRDYQRNHAAMDALLELRHWRDSGMSEAGRDALLSVELEAAKALRDYCA
ncbi:hypothetical protein ACR3H8_33375 [Pseudomonas aeruginosa]|uniref:hypothetical protein n=1 Tax=Pseudomonas aeruginosa TaxID=287 RepID=UPI000F825EF8|nr:hypothetical protein [Pseudomonas aeruginosa]MCT5450663.1 hypothetical protein [Pseudomonas aeruginosa]RTW12280.1 hypothetical protein DZA03_28815 [Pseudomonas aeruginosa]